jgi:hypothetical protein
MKSKILAIPCNGLDGIFKIGRLSLTGSRRQVFTSKFTLKANPAKNTMPGKSAESVKSVKIRANQWLKMKKSVKNIENVVISVQKLTQMASTIRLFMQNKPNFPHFSLKNDDFTKKQSQFKPNSNPNKPNFGPKIRVAKPNKPKFYPRFRLTLLFCRGTNPIKIITKHAPSAVEWANNQSSLIDNQAVQSCPRLSHSGTRFQKMCRPTASYRQKCIFKIYLKNCPIYEQSFNIRPYLIDNSSVYALYGHIYRFITQKWRRFFNAY